MTRQRIYVCIDLKSFYASVECMERRLDPMTTNLVVADASRTEKTICLAVSPSLKAYGIAGRARLFEVVQKVREVNTQRQRMAPKHGLTGESYNDLELKSDASLSTATSSRRRRWRAIWRSARRFTTSTSSTFQPRTSMCIPLMKYSWM